MRVRGEACCRLIRPPITHPGSCPSTRCSAKTLGVLHTEEGLQRLEERRGLSNPNPDPSRKSNPKPNPDPNPSPDPSPNPNPNPNQERKVISAAQREGLSAAPPERRHDLVLQW